MSLSFKLTMVLFISLTLLCFTDTLLAGTSPSMGKKGMDSNPKTELEISRHCILESVKNKRKSLKELSFSDISPSLNLTDQKTLPDLIQSFQRSLEKSLDVLPERKNILIISPHPDDDVISMGGTIRKLLGRHNTIYVVYVVTGTNSVRETFASFQHHYKTLKIQKKREEDPTLILEAKAQVREAEARKATSRLGIPSQNLHFFRADYYTRRGLKGINPITSRDRQRMQDLLIQMSPDYIYFAAEEDPHGAHGLASTLLAQALSQQKELKRVNIVGYRGAWDEWSLAYADKLSITLFDSQLMQLKIQAIKDHGSQLNAMYPGEDSREFYERAELRNSAYAKDLVLLLPEKVEKGLYAEAFYHFDLREFLNLYS